MSVQFQGVTVDALPGAREGRPDGFHAFLEPAAPALEDPEPHVGPRLSEKREVNAEPVVVPRRRTALPEEFGQPLLAVGSQPVHLQRPAPPPCPRRPAWRRRLGHTLRRRDAPGGLKLLQASITRPG